MAPGQTQTCAWRVPPTLGPGQQDFSTVAYTYRSTVDPTAHENAGLIGAVVIGRLVSFTPSKHPLRTYLSCSTMASCPDFDLAEQTFHSQSIRPLGLSPS